MALLTLRDVGRRYGALKVVDKVSFQVEAGEAIGVLGPNGAGKTTLMKLIAGIVALSEGEVHFDGARVDRLSPQARCHMGISRTNQVPQPFGGMSVWENVLAAARNGGRHDKVAAENETYESLRRTGLLDRHGRLADELPLMGRKRLELARALACRPRLLLLDEIAGGLSDFEVKDLVQLVREINAKGTSVVLVEQSVNIALSLVDHAYFMEKGEIRFDGPDAELLQRDDLLRAVFLEGATKAGVR